jgi:hypothetical protein
LWERTEEENRLEAEARGRRERGEMFDSLLNSKFYNKWYRNLSCWFSLARD